MSYRLTPDETLSDAIKRIVIEQANQAIERLESQSGSQDDAIHDARVCFKKIRAGLRLVQTDFAPDTFRQENICYRDAGRRLSALRDMAAMRETLDKLAVRFAEQLAPNAFSELYRLLRKSSSAQRLEQKKVLLEVAKIIAAARRRVEHWPIRQNDFSALGQGVKRVYKRGRHSFANAVAQPSVEHFHEWRKDVKHLRYQIRIIKPIWATILGRLGDELEAMGEHLSEDHDLALLRQHMIELAEPTDNRVDLEALIALIDRRRAELHAEAKGLGERMYAERPRAFTDRLQVYWQAWRSDKPIDAITVSREAGLN